MPTLDTLANVKEGVQRTDRKAVAVGPNAALQVIVTDQGQKHLKNASKAQRSAITKAIGQLVLLAGTGTAAALYVKAQSLGLQDLIDAVGPGELASLTGALTLVEASGILALGKGALVDRNTAQEERVNALKDTTRKWTQLIQDNAVGQSLKQRSHFQSDLQKAFGSTFKSRLPFFGLSDDRIGRAVKPLVRKAVAQSSSIAASVKEKDEEGLASRKSGGEGASLDDGVEVISRTVHGLAEVADLLGTAATNAKVNDIEVQLAQAPRAPTNDPVGFGSGEDDDEYSLA